MSDWSDDESTSTAVAATVKGDISFSLLVGKGTGFPIKDARFSKIKNIPDLSDDKEGK